MTTRVEIPLRFNDDSEIIVIRDKELVRRIPVLVRAISSQTDEWEATDTVLDDPMLIPFHRASATFLFEHVRTYVAPEASDEFATIDNYGEANKLSLDELKDLIELANFMECVDFVSAIGFVIADKLRPLSTEQIAAYMGVECLAEPDGYDEDQEWIHPPLAHFQQLNNNQ